MIITTRIPSSDYWNLRNTYLIWLIIDWHYHGVFMTLVQSSPAVMIEIFRDSSSPQSILGPTLFLWPAGVAAAYGKDVRWRKRDCVHSGSFASVRDIHWRAIDSPFAYIALFYSTLPYQLFAGDVYVRLISIDKLCSLSTCILVHLIAENW